MPTFRHEVAVDIKPFRNMLYMTWSELMATMAIARNKANLLMCFRFFIMQERNRVKSLASTRINVHIRNEVFGFVRSQVQGRWTKVSAFDVLGSRHIVGYGDRDSVSTGQKREFLGRGLFVDDFLR